MKIPFCILSSLLAAAATLAGPPFFSITDLGTLGGRESRAYALNAGGMVCGEGATAQGSMHAFRWTPGAEAQDLGTLGGPTSRAYDLNGAGWVVGEADGTNAARQPFCWTPEGGLTALPLPPGAHGGVAHAINDAGQIAGAVELASGPCAALWPSPTNTPVLLTATGMAGLAFGINRHGWVVGQSEMGEAEARVTRAFQRDPEGVVAGLTEQGEGLSSTARAINESGQVIGSYEVRPGITHAILFDPNGLRDLDDRNNVFSAAYGVNAGGDTVGGFFNGPDDDDQAFLATTEGMWNLDDLLDTREVWHVVEAWDINDDRLIVGCALKAGLLHAVLLTPVNASGRVPPTVRLLEPAAGARFAPGAGMVLVAEASAADGVKRVTFLANNLVVGSATSAPYRLEWAHAPAGDVDLVARATTRSGRANDSGRVRVRVELPANAQPVVTWLEPVEGATVAMGSHVLFRAEARDPDGRVVGLELWRDGTNIASAEGAMLGEAWPAGPAGHFGFAVVAEDDRGGRMTSEVRRVEVKDISGEPVPAL